MDTLGLSGRIARFFQSAQITPLLALVALLLGAFAVLVTPREEEPQINVTMANVIIPFPGAAVKDVEQMVAVPAEQVLSQIAGTEHVMRRGFAARSASEPMPSRSMVPGVKLSTTTSAVSARARNAATPASDFRFTVTDRRDRLHTL